ncbi:hypothetical protein DICPUDRAFT_82126 [Dictyostelium purpureum]|uniref:G-protein coupled receptors family 2 profile 2 domain-containing protein n=1 Tax=Dictyostelium purpureum TaxID=5786 RepID=F0ZVL1_DICPU|nr:uncharacterized protein DICPUDRAFT_82126 [Dictyostelium purpureum]EGC31999.1 hypothetical protein DICPUDRAFT_82126 [Dictyostelium purpureum]|eukprot:XP_003291455.1 hypothetical protein DICPUDRAFT_82126 [Dictyostelium purpureum]
MITLYSYVLNWIGSIACFVGCLFIIAHFCWIPLLRTSLSKIIIFPTFVLLLYDLISFPSFISKNISLYINRSTILCNLEESILQFLIVSNFMWSVCISVNLLYLCFNSNKNLKKKELLYHLVSWGIPLLVVVISKIPNMISDNGNQCRYKSPNYIKFYLENTIFIAIITFNFIVAFITIKHIISGNLRESETNTTSVLFINEKKITTKKIVWRLLLYPSILSICYLMTLVLTIYQFTVSSKDLAVQNRLNALLYTAKGVFLLQGFFNALVYLRSSKLRDRYKRIYIFKRICWPDLVDYQSINNQQ